MRSGHCRDGHHAKCPAPLGCTCDCHDGQEAPEPVIPDLGGSIPPRAGYVSPVDVLLADEPDDDDDDEFPCNYASCNYVGKSRQGLMVHTGRSHKSEVDYAALAREIEPEPEPEPPSDDVVVAAKLVELLEDLLFAARTDRDKARAAVAEIQQELTDREAEVRVIERILKRKSAEVASGARPRDCRR